MNTVPSTQALSLSLLPFQDKLHQRLTGSTTCWREEPQMDRAGASGVLLEWGLRALPQRRVPIQERANRARPAWRPTYSRHPLEEVCFRTLLHPLRSRGDGTAPHKSNGHLKNSHLVPGYPLKSTTTATTTMREVSFSRGEPFPRRLLNGNTSSAPVPNRTLCS